MKYTIVRADDHWFRQNINCQYACPVNTPAMNYIERIVVGNFDSSLLLNTMANLFPHILGRVCTHPCETACRRGVIDSPISICSLKRSAADFSVNKFPQKKVVVRKTGKRIAIIGSGPCGLAAAHDLAVKGHDAIIYEALSVAGGMLQVGIPPYRLPRAIIEDSINWIKGFGVEILLNTPVDAPEKFDELLNSFDAVYIATGAHKSSRMDIPGEELGGVMHGVSFMKDTNLGIIKSVPKKIVVIGGGFTAIDCARSSLRLGASEVSIVYRRSREEMPAGEIEVRMAEEEGITMLYLTSPVKLTGQNGIATHMECVKNKLGEPDAPGRRRPETIEGSNFTMSVDMVIPAIGQAPDITFLSDRFGIKVNKWGMPLIDGETGMTSRRGAFAGGDCVTGPRNVIEVIADGRKAASAIHTYLTNREKEGFQFHYKSQNPSKRVSNYEVVPRQHQESLPLDDRGCFDAESELGLSRENALKEANRCLLCHFNIFIDEKCVLCGGCIDVCPYNCISMVSRENVSMQNSRHDEDDISEDWDAAMIIDEEKCIRCGLCVKRCPVGAITMKRFAYSEG
ncbi:MAG: 4Fe-4S dicluster domain-containing protein [Planctomycetes bacterium]|nr:4Fe-4S dicluster domain-containing protein [Planctomycetota bacterium]